MFALTGDFSLRRTKRRCNEGAQDHDDDDDDDGYELDGVKHLSLQVAFYRLVSFVCECFTATALFHIPFYMLIAILI